MNQFLNYGSFNENELFSIMHNNMFVLRRIYTDFCAIIRFSYSSHTL